ncbi:RNA polymerase RpoN-/SigL-like sigma 54 subunit [Anaerobacterium chartisolvens]|uniref:RNA polymerase RpoN-/SigL-like sigma 54 subunit n=1 Tax=Anaerobacterium chartisolvens TaxID=1297424 RepID=A0A369AQA2_9FIRM|nr:RNA polymerase factor sigma-54 [Anaerobacterium chartisolvens]RCX10518.1 RNA polymerase RpoN-/SigL-like sigma 54 subunit [Anaerobacterium chartisolvens]
MNLYFDFNLAQSPKILMTPQLRQALEILKMNSQELFEYVEEQLEVNPALEMQEDENCMGDEECGYSDGRGWWIDSGVSCTGTQAPACEESEDSGSPNETDKNVRMSLKEHLLFQLHTSSLNEVQICIGEYLIDNIDQNGYLMISVSEVAEFFNVNSAKIKKVLEYIQTFDPPGICARSLKECLLIQLAQMENKDENIKRIVDKHLDDLADERIDVVAKATGLSGAQVEAVYRFIKTLEPKPGREYESGSDVKYIIPDISIRQLKSGAEVIVNDEAFPALGINQYYKKILSAEISNDAKKFIMNRMDSASWIIKCIEHRKNTIVEIARHIVKSQEDFLKKGRKYIKTVDNAKISGEIGIHESMLKEVATGKYMQCVWGIFELKCFFK